MNKHVVPPKTRSPKTDGGNAPDVQELSPPCSADAKARKPQTEQPRAETPAAEKPQTAKSGTREAEARTFARETVETGPLRWAFWTRRRLVTTAILAAILLGAIHWWPFGGTQSKVVYSFVKAAHSNVVVTLHSTGSLEARNSVDVVAPAAGRVESLAVKSGDRVTKGQSLAHLVSETVRAGLTSGEAELAARRADLARATIDVTEARAELMRARSETRPGAIDTGEARLARMSANADEARQLVQAAQQNVASARAALAGLDLRAPFDGMVLRTDFEPSNGVATISRGQPLCTLVHDLSTFDIRANFPERALSGLHSGARAEFTAPAFPLRIFAAKLTALDLWPKREVKDGKEIVVYSATLTGADPDGVLRPGMSADVAIVAAEARNALVVPSSALGFAPPPKIESQFPPLKMPAGAAHMSRIWVLTNGKAEPRDVFLGLSDDRVTQVVSGPLHEGDDVITSAAVTTTR